MRDPADEQDGDDKKPDAILVHLVDFNRRRVGVSMEKIASTPFSSNHSGPGDHFDYT